MTYTNALKRSFSIINHRWQLVAVQAGMLLLNCALLFIVVGVPLGIAFIIFGLDLTGLAETRDIFGLFKDPGELLSKYFGLVIFVLAGFLLYLVLVTTLGLYVFAGTVGVIRRAVEDPLSTFRMKDFFHEAKEIFFPLMWFSFVMGLIFIGVAFVLGLLGGGGAAIVSYAKSQDSTLGLFIGLFLSLVLGLVLIAIFLAALAVTLYGVAILVFRREGAIQTVKTSFSFLGSHPAAFWFYVILFAGYVAVSFMFMLLTYPFNLIPLIGTLISFPLQLLSSIAQSYLGLVLITAVFSYYHSFSSDTQAAPGAGSTPPGNISDSEAPQPAAPPQAEDDLSESV